MIIQKLPKIDGRTFVCGDLHGAFERVQQFLEHIKFDKTRDRLISVGDLVDRGPQNEECLDLINQDWFFAVKGNHEDLMLNFYNQRSGGEWWIPNGGGWGLEHIDRATTDGEFLINNQFMFDAVNRAAQLPLMITVEQNDGSFFHVIHAELNGSAKNLITNEQLHDEQKFLEIASGKTFEGGTVVLWKRSLFYNFYAVELDADTKATVKNGRLKGRYQTIFANDLDTIYSGHTIVQKPLRYHRQINLDTCAYGSIVPASDPDFKPRPPSWAGLTITEPVTGQFWVVKADGVHDQELFDLGVGPNDQLEPEEPFAPRIVKDDF